MAESQFLELVEHAAGIGREEARQAVRAILCTLAERITRSEAEDIAVFVPGEFRELLTGSPHRAEPFGVAEFVHRVADRGGTCGSSRVAVIS
jgi:uncharacterized protein (DUF2267 family)